MTKNTAVLIGAAALGGIAGVHNESVVIGLLTFVVLGGMGLRARSAGSGGGSPDGGSCG